MTTYAIKVQHMMRSTNPRYNTEGPMTLYHYIGRNGWMSGQPMYEGYSTLRGAKIGLAAYMKQHEDFIKKPLYKDGFWDEAVIGIVPMDGEKERLPKVETEVLITCNRNGHRFVCPAIYEDGTVLTQDSIWNWYDLDDYGTYSEEDDDYFVPQGWWENRQFTPDDVYNSLVDCTVTDWMPLPNLPKR